MVKQYVDLIQMVTIDKNLIDLMTHHLSIDFELKNSFTSFYRETIISTLMVKHFFLLIYAIRGERILLFQTLCHKKKKDLLNGSMYKCFSFFFFFHVSISKWSFPSLLAQCCHELKDVQISMLSVGFVCHFYQPTAVCVSNV